MAWEGLAQLGCARHSQSCAARLEGLLPSCPELEVPEAGGIPELVGLELNGPSPPFHPSRPAEGKLLPGQLRAELCRAAFPVLAAMGMARSPGAYQAS